MSLIGAFGNWKNDLNKLLLNERELFKLSSAPLVIYKLRATGDQPATDNFYGEITDKKYENGVELIGFFQNPSLVLELIKFGLDVPEQITAYFDSEWMNSKLGRVFQPGDLIQPPHQRNQIYIVQNSFPNWTTEKFFKNTQWQVIAQKYELSGYDLPPYLLWNECVSHIPFSEHWKTEFLADRKGFLEQRALRIYGNLDDFWQYGDFYEQYEIGYFNGVDNYLNFGNNYNMGTSGFAIEICIKPDLAGGDYVSGTDNIPLINKGAILNIEIGSDGSVEVFFNGVLYTWAAGTVVTGVWNVLLFNFTPASSNPTVARTLKLFKNGAGTAKTVANPWTFTNSNDLLIGADYDKNSHYKGKMSNIRIFSRALTDAEALTNEYNNLITRNFYTR